MPASGPNEISHVIWAERLESHEEAGIELRNNLVTSLMPWLREQMAKSGTINYWQLPELARSLKIKQVTQDVLLSVAEQLVRSGEWIDNKDTEHGDHWAPNPDFDPAALS